jgi:hypothetical protein
MTDLSRDLRRALETTVKAARSSAELAAADALRRLGVFEQRRPEHLTETRNTIRKRLRAHAKSIGDPLDGADGAPLKRLTEAAAYVQWHRLLFARFLAERELLRDDAGIVVSLADCREEAVVGGAGDEWSIAAAHAARMLPGVFPPDDPVEALVLAPEYAKALRDHLRRLDTAVFTADDSLGWTYQFWRAAEKKAVNDSRAKIGAAELPAVTQLFTESYMVRFLFHNTLGAWWAGKLLLERPELARDAVDEAALRAACALPGYEWEYLRFVRTDDLWRPAAGTFPGWPKHAASITLLDPCCGSGHFLTEALAALAALRAAQEGFSQAEAVTAALRDNLHGLEIDGRCVQIAAFALALTAWRIGGAGTALPMPHVAWVGAPPPLGRADFAALANDDTNLRRGLEALHDLFAQAPLLGSLIEVTGGDLMSPARIAGIENSITALVERMRDAEPERVEGALAARGMADAAAILARRFVLQITNVPFLTASKMVDTLKDYVADRFTEGRAELATCFLMSMTGRVCKGGAIALVSPQNWYQLSSYEELRKRLLCETEIRLICDLGPGAFHDMNWWAARTALTVIEDMAPNAKSALSGIDAQVGKDPAIKAAALIQNLPVLLLQNRLFENPDSRFSVIELKKAKLLSSAARSYQGLKTGDDKRYRRFFWEVKCVKFPWRFLQSTVVENVAFGGRESIVRWDRDGQNLARRQGMEAFTKNGITVSQMRMLPVTRYSGDAFDSNVAPIIPNDPSDLPAIWAFCSSSAYLEEIRKIDGKVAVANGTLLKVPFDVAYWREVAAEEYPEGLPGSFSNDPTQWLFHGHPRYAERGTELLVALSRLAGYRWPAEIDADICLSREAQERTAEAATIPKSDSDGLLAMVPVLGERPLADQLRALCASAWGQAWGAGTEATLIAASCDRIKDKAPKQLTLDQWLRTHAARQHAKLFQDRPFLWWVTDGRSDGCTVVVNYHRLTRAHLERLTWTVIGDWITRLGKDPRSEAAQVLQSKLARILEGEAPHDIFIRWKSAGDQALGWDPDLDDGVRLNIRPFIEAGVLGHIPNVSYGVDGGKDNSNAPWSAMFDGERRNGHHLTLEQKRAARASAAA